MGRLQGFGSLLEKFGLVLASRETSRIKIQIICPLRPDHCYGMEIVLFRIVIYYESDAEARSILSNVRR